jgi:uncharacterized damage-inducible protein DinB
MAFVKGPALLDIALARLPKESLGFKPGPEKWSIQDIVFHVAEDEVHGYLRARTAISEPGAGIQAFDQNLWAQSANADAQSMDEAVALCRLLRGMLARQLRALPEAVWEQQVVHPEKGNVPLERLLELYVKHMEVHLAQMDRTYQAFCTN